MKHSKSTASPNVHCGVDRVSALRNIRASRNFSKSTRLVGDALLALDLYLRRRHPEPSARSNTIHIILF